MTDGSVECLFGSEREEGALIPYFYSFSRHLLLSRGS